MEPGVISARVFECQFDVVSGGFSDEDFGIIGGEEGFEWDVSVFF